MQTSLKSIRSISFSSASSYYSSLEYELNFEKKHKLYGDIVVAACMSLATPALAFRMFSEGGLENFDAAVMVGGVSVSAMFHFLAWKYDSVLCSRLAFLANCFTGSFMEIKEWPVKGICTITQRFQSGVICLCLANLSLSAYEQTVRLLAIFAIGSYISITSPYSVYTEDALPGLGGAVLVAFVWLYIHNNSTSIRKNIEVGFHQGIFDIRVQKDEFMVQSARLALVAIYSYTSFHSFFDAFGQNATAEDVVAGFWELFKASMIATVGSVATGVFKSNIDQKEELEIMVRERTKEIRMKNIELRRINIAFEACETAIAITDASRTVIWTNQAFESLSKKTRDDDDYGWSSLDQQLTDAILVNGKENETKLRGAFDFSSPRQDKIEVQGNGSEGQYSSNSQYRVEVTPFLDHYELDEEDEIESIESTAKEADSVPKGRGNGRRVSFQANNPQRLFLVAFNDITAECAREEAEKNAQQEALLSKAMKDSMVTLTHELRTPLQGIMGITSLMLEQKDSEEGAKQSFVQDNSESLGLIMASSSLLLNLINNLLDVKKATANMMDEFLLTPLLASDPIRDAIDFCNPLASISKVNIVMDCFGGESETFVNANALRLQQVLINMISNAIKYTDLGTNITVKTRPSTVGETINTLRKAIASCSDWEDPASETLSESAPVLVFSVSDSGPGIAQDQARKLFQRFARLSQPTRTLGKNAVGQPSGTGLGLNLCQMFVTRMQGWIWAENNDGRGSTFSFCLPMVGSPEEPMDALALQTATDMIPSHLGPMGRRRSIRDGIYPLLTMDYRKLRVLVVDDTLINRKVLDRMLKKIGIDQVVTVESGEDALVELFSSGKTYDLVITDLQMPEMSGTELCEEIIRRETKSKDLASPTDSVSLAMFKRLVVVGLTADTSPGVAENCAASGMSDVLYKPITLVEIKDYFQTKISRLQPGQWCWK